MNKFKTAILTGAMVAMLPLAVQAKDAPMVKELKKAASTGALEVKSLQVIIDNDVSFESKLIAIHSAKKSIDMVYYIYAEDYSSSRLTKALMDKAEANKEKIEKGEFRIRLLVDYLTNLKHADLFLSMERAGIEVKLYNKPTTSIKHNAVFLSTACAKGKAGEACVKDKDKKSKELKNSGNGTDFMSRVLLTGLYAKSVDLIKAAIVHGQEIDLDSLKQGAEADEQEKAQLKEFAKLFYRAQVKGELSAKFKLWLALQIYGEKVMPIYNLITQSAPFTSDHKTARDWEFISDYTHHKLLLVDGVLAQMGGRNIEDSYHMKTNDLTPAKDAKYIFMDTDVALYLSEKSGKELQATYDRLWNLDFMNSDMSEVDKSMELEALARPDLLGGAIQSCATGARKKTEANAACVERRFEDLSKMDGVGRFERLNAKDAEIITKAARYRNEHKADKAEIDKINNNGEKILGHGFMSEADLATAKIHYIENLPCVRPNWFERNILGKKMCQKRQFGASVQNALRSSKNINHLFVKGLENVCKSTTSSKEVVLHNAYFFPSPQVMRAFGNMMNGKWNCEGVTVTLITNSYFTTDLFPVNAMAALQLKAIVDVNNEEIRKGNKKAAKFKVVEYLKKGETDRRSLHSKVSLLGDDLIIGSANLDIRSYAMDTNNGIYIQNAKELAADYRNYIGQLLTGQIVDADGTPRFPLYEANGLITTGGKKDGSYATKDEYIAGQVMNLQKAAAENERANKWFAKESNQDLVKSMMDFIHRVAVSSLDSSRIQPANPEDIESDEQLEDFQKDEQRRYERLIQNLLSII